MASWFFRPVKRDRMTPAPEPERDYRSKVIGQGRQGAVKRGSVIADRLAQTISTRTHK